MNRRRIGWLASLLAALALFVAVPVMGGEEQTSTEASGVKSNTEERVQEEVDEKLAERREAMLKEAHAALDETNAALRALEEGKNQEALEALARATGKLELLVARDPELALAPVDMQVVTYDLYATPKAIRAARDEAETLLEDGKVQEARVLLSTLASEIVISVRNLPLATYPDAIKAISPLIDEGKSEEAQVALRAALNTIVVTKHVVSLPVLRAGHLLAEAEELLGKEERSEQEQEQIDQLVATARAQLEIAEVLGYGRDADYEKFREQVAELEAKIRGDEPTEGTFARLRQSLAGLQTSFFD